MRVRALGPPASVVGVCSIVPSVGQWFVLSIGRWFVCSMVRSFVRSFARCLVVGNKLEQKSENSRFFKFKSFYFS